MVQMQHFHIMRWHALEIATGECISVADTDYASVATEREARRVSSGFTTEGDHCVVVPCRSAACTLHGARTALPTPAFC
jgi:hypothetical protein